MSLMQTLINVAERAAKIARVIRQEPHLFALLVEEKNDLDKNQRFAQDFKTLADVLIQETLRYYVSFKFPKLSEYVKGEENSFFTNKLGETITVSVCNTQKETAELLANVLNGNTKAASLLSHVVHEPDDNVEIELQLQHMIPDINTEDIGVWIDPIDSTAEYIAGNSGKLHFGTNIHENGLECVTILIGVYEKLTGLPIGGVVTQPFGYQTSSRWHSYSHWGLVYNNVSIHSLSKPRKFTETNADTSYQSIVLSASECSQIKRALDGRFKLFSVTGAGYKCLVTALGFAEAYVCSKGSTYRWDTSAPHGILRALGGGIISFKSFLQIGSCQELTNVKSLDSSQIVYHEGNHSGAGSQLWCNVDGVVAYRNPKVLLLIYDCLKDVLP